MTHSEEIIKILQAYQQSYSKMYRNMFLLYFWSERTWVKIPNRKVFSIIGRQTIFMIPLLFYIKKFLILSYCWHQTIVKLTKHVLTINTSVEVDTSNKFGLALGI